MRTRVAAYAVIVDSGRMLLAHWNSRERSGWTLPGGGLEFGEAPGDAAVREVAEETGYDAALDDLLGLDSVVIEPGRSDAYDGSTADGRPLHALRIVYTAHVTGGQLRDEVDGTTDTAAWFDLAEVDGLDRVELVDVGRRLAGLLDRLPAQGE